MNEASADEETMLLLLHRGGLPASSVWVLHVGKVSHMSPDDYEDLFIKAGDRKTRKGLA